MSDLLETTFALEKQDYLYLRDISEPRDNSLRLFVEQAAPNREKTASTQPSLGRFPELAGILKGAVPIEPTKGCKAFVLEWARYVAYLVTEECVGSCGNYDDEIYSGRLMREYTKSHFLDHLAKDTGGHFEPILHYKLVCLNHMVDVASIAPPNIREL